MYGKHTTGTWDEKGWEPLAYDTVKQENGKAADAHNTRTKIKLTEWRVVTHIVNQVVIAQWLAWPLATGEVPGSNPSKGENLVISD